MQVRWVFCVESVHRCRSAETDGDFSATRQVQPAEPQIVSRLAQAVDALPYPFQHTGIHRFVERMTGDHAEDLGTGGDTALSREQLCEL
ncbi:hypothetical protein A5784_09100 [Mycobacterium sp. 852013-50091_SCH5140682]|nr:hypothetical protein A5784_09100 [Mycobacterium sp. 852013-50091_SCH5140682]